MKTLTFSQTKEKRGVDEYYQHIVNHPQTQHYYLLRDHDAIGFVLGMGKIELGGAPFSNGGELLDFALNNKHLSSPEILFPHKSVIVLFRLDGQRPVVIVSTSALRLKEALPALFQGVYPQTQETLEFLVQQSGEKEVECLELPDEVDPTDPLVANRPDLIPFAECYQDLRKLGYRGVVIVPKLIEIPQEYWQGGVHMEVVPVTDESAKAFCQFEDKRLWDDVHYYVPKHYLLATANVEVRAA